MLYVMFSGKFDVQSDEDGCIFIDRNGRIFAHVLDYLRTGLVSPFLSEEDKFWLQEEARYFQLSKLTQALSKSSAKETWSISSFGSGSGYPRNEWKVLNESLGKNPNKVPQLIHVTEQLATIVFKQTE